MPTATAVTSRHPTRHPWSAASTTCAADVARSCERMDQAHKLAISRGLQGSTIDTTVLRELVIEAYEQARDAYLKAAPSTVQVGAQQAQLKLTEPSRRVRY